MKETQADRDRKSRFLGIETDPKRKGLKQKFSEGFKHSVIWAGQKIHGQKPEGGTSSLSRNHVIEIAPSGLVSVMGGKWTTFRQIGQDAVEMLLQDRKDLEPKYT